MMGKLKKLTGYRLFLPLSCLIIVLLINLITTPTFFKITINNGVLYGYIIDVINRASELVVLAVGMTLVVSASAGTDISVGAVMAVAASVCTHVLAGGEVSVNEYANPYILAVLAGLAVAVLCGCFNGFLVAKLKIQPMVATLILFTEGESHSWSPTDRSPISVWTDISCWAPISRESPFPPPFLWRSWWWSSPMYSLKRRPWECTCRPWALMNGLPAWWVLSPQRSSGWLMRSAAFAQA